MIGHLQRNKIKPILPLVSLIHSVDSLRLAEELDAHAAKANRKLPVLMQVNASEEAQKSGVAVGAAVHLAEQIDSMENLQIIGLMTMAPLEGDEQTIRQVFARTREIFEEMKCHKIGGTAHAPPEHGDEQRFRARHRGGGDDGPHRHAAVRRESGR